MSTLVRNCSSVLLLDKVHTSDSLTTDVVDPDGLRVCRSMFLLIQRELHPLHFWSIQPRGLLLLNGNTLLQSVVGGCHSASRICLLSLEKVVFLRQKLMILLRLCVKLLVHSCDGSKLAQPAAKFSHLHRSWTTPVRVVALEPVRVISSEVFFLKRCTHQNATVPMSPHSCNPVPIVLYHRTHCTVPPYRTYVPTVPYQCTVPMYPPYRTTYQFSGSGAIVAESVTIVTDPIESAAIVTDSATIVTDLKKRYMVRYGGYIGTVHWYGTVVQYHGTEVRYKGYGGTIQWVQWYSAIVHLLKWTLICGRPTQMAQIHTLCQCNLICLNRLFIFQLQSEPFCIAGSEIQ